MSFDNIKDRCVSWSTHPVAPLVVAAGNPATKLYGINQPGARLATFDTVLGTIVTEIPTGPGLVSMAVRPGTSEIWATDRVTSSVTVIDEQAAVIIETIRVGAEPHGIVFSPSGDRAYVACSGVDRVDVIDAASRAVIRGIAIPAKRPRALAIVDDVVWVASFLSGNNTAPVGASTSSTGVVDVVGIESLAGYGGGVVELPDRDLLAIPIQADPALDDVDLARTVRGVGTVLFNLHARPGTSELWVPNTEALNAVHIGDKNFVAGQFVSNRITIVDATGVTPPRIIDLDAIAPSQVKCAQPTGLAFDPVRPRVYVCGYGSDLVAVLDISGPTPTWLGHVDLPFKQTYPKFTGPRACTIEPLGRFLFVFNQGDNSVSKIDLTSLTGSIPFAKTAGVPISLGFEPLSGEERQGRNHFINARTSKSQTTSCASCHVDGDTDGIVWDLSRFLDPEGTPNGQLVHPLDDKGPLFTQSTRRLAESGPYHWRGERDRLIDFNAAFIDLFEHTKGGQPANIGPDIRYLEHYIKRTVYPANPKQNLDRSWTPLQQKGANLFASKPVLVGATCATCHVLPLGTGGEVTQSHVAGKFDTADVAQLRGVTSKLAPPFDVGAAFGTRTELGAGLSHGGAFGSVRDLLLAPHPTIAGASVFDLDGGDADAIAAFLDAFDTGLAPATAYQATATTDNVGTFFADHLAFLLAQAEHGYCDVIYRHGWTQVGSESASVSGMYDVEIHRFVTARATDAPVDPQALVALAAQGVPVTFVGVPGLMGRPMALDRDLDGLLDLDELARGADPEILDTDDDSYPDGYEVLWGMNPLAHDSGSPDATPPAFAKPPKVVYATTNTIKFEFATNEVCRVQLSYNGGIPVQRLPLQNEFDFEFSVVLHELEPATTYALDFELKDPSGNVAHVPWTLKTRPRSFVEPAFVRDIALTLDKLATPPRLRIVVEIAVGEGAPPPGYQLEGAAYYRNAAGVITTIDPTVQSGSSAADGRVDIELPLLQSGPGDFHFTIRAVHAPPGAPPYAAAFSLETYASTTW